jgi:2-amino-4-hydroxy-6-hydroxymethyldihydropteridine diphosphokinase
MHHIYLGIGGNLGDREANLEETRMFIEFNFGDIVQASSIYETAPWQMDDAPSFLNQVLLVSTELKPQDVVTEIQELAIFYGKAPSSREHYQNREMDVDLLFYDDLIMEEEALTIPHPRLHLRKFVLIPLHEIAPDLVHPIFKESVSALLQRCTDESLVRKYGA